MILTIITLIGIVMFIGFLLTFLELKIKEYLLIL